MQHFKKYIEEDTENTDYNSDIIKQVHEIDFDNIKDVVYLSIIECGPQDPIKYRFITRSGSNYKTMAIDNIENKICMDSIKKIIESDCIECLVTTSLTISSFAIKDLSNIGRIIIYVTIGCIIIYINKNILNKLYIYTPSLIKIKERFKSKTISDYQKYQIFDISTDIEIVQIKFYNYKQIIYDYNNNIDGTKLLLLPDDIKSAITEYF